MGALLLLYTSFTATLCSLCGQQPCSERSITMKKLHFEYRMKLAFDHPVRQHRFTLRCVPISNERQQIHVFDTDVYPKEFLSADMDSFGNYCIYGYSEGQHDHFSVSVTGTAKTGLSSFETAPEDYQLGLFRYQTECTRPGPCIRTFHERFSFPDETESIDRAIAYMEALYREFQYVQGVTGISTTAEEALNLGKGVCQDYSHILLSLCRLDRIPCRYVVGMLLGEGLSHAWVEVCSNGRWIALDPTNNLIVDDRHIKISSGRDYKDCTINQGLFVGQTTQTQTIHVSVTESWEGENNYDKDCCGSRASR